MLSLTTGLFRRADAVMSPKAKRTDDARVSIHARVSPSLVERLEKIAAQEMRTFSNMVEYILTQYVESRPQRGTTRR